MTANHFTELEAWQLADELQTFVVHLLERTIWRDANLVAQINKSSSSAPSNIAEGFGRFGGDQFGHFLRIAIASEAETKNHLIKAANRRYIAIADRNHGLGLATRASKAATSLRRYVLSPEGRENAKRIEAKFQSRRKKRTETETESQSEPEPEPEP